MEISNDNTFTITGGPLKPHEFIVIKKEMNAADEAWINDHSATMSGTKKNPQMQLTVGQIKLAALKRMILRWQLTKTITGPDGQETEIQVLLSEQAIEELPRRVSSYVNKVIDELNPEEEEDEDFTHAANGRSEGSFAMTKRLQAKG